MYIPTSFKVKCKVNKLSCLFDKWKHNWLIMPTFCSDWVKNCSINKLVIGMTVPPYTLQEYWPCTVCGIYWFGGQDVKCQGHKVTFGMRLQCMSNWPLIKMLLLSVFCKFVLHTSLCQGFVMVAYYQALFFLFILCDTCRLRYCRLVWKWERIIACLIKHS